MARPRRCRWRSARAGTTSTSAGCSSASSRSSTTTSAARRRSSSPARASAPTTRRTSRCAARTSSRSRSARAASTTSRSSAGASAATPSYFHNPMDYVAISAANTSTGCAGRSTLVLTVGRGQWEDTTGALESTQRFAALLAEKGIRHELDVWGRRVAARLGLLARAARRTTCRASSDGDLRGDARRRPCGRAACSAVPSRTACMTPAGMLHFVSTVPARAPGGGSGRRRWTASSSPGRRRGLNWESDTEGGGVRGPDRPSRPRGAAGSARPCGR